MCKLAYLKVIWLTGTLNGFLTSRSLMAYHLAYWRVTWHLTYWRVAWLTGVSISWHISPMFKWPVVRLTGVSYILQATPGLYDKLTALLSISWLVIVSRIYSAYHMAYWLVIILLKAPGLGVLSAVLMCYLPDTPAGWLTCHLAY